MSEYQVGGSLNASASSYVIRQADRQIYNSLMQGEFCYVFNCRQMGKSSLRVRVRKRLEQQGYACVSLDMTNIGSQNLSIFQWYKSIASELWRGFNLIGQVPFKAWWSEHSELSPIQILNLFISDVVLPAVKAEKLFIFIDEIDSVLSLNFSTDDFFALIRYFYNARSENPDFKRLSFALFGVATPSELIRDSSRTPFNIGKAIALGRLELPEAMSLAAGLSELLSEPEQFIQEVIYWTGGQPFLMQKLCNLAFTALEQQEQSLKTVNRNLTAWVEQLVRNQIVDRWESQDEPEHFKTIRERLLRNEQKSGKLLAIYRRIWLDGAILIDNSLEQQDLILSGLVIKENSSLILRNPIYRQIFDLDWIDQQLDNLRPYSEAINQWLASDCTDESRLLRGQAFRDAQAWAHGKILGDVDYRFLSASQELRQRITRRNLETARLKEVEARLESQKLNDKRQKILIFALSFALCLATVLGLYARRQYNKAIASEAEIAKSQRQTLVSAIKAIATSSEALFASDQRLEALTQAVKAKVELNKLDSQEPELEAQVDRDLRRAIYGIQEVNRLSGHTGSIWEIDFSPDSQLILSASEDNTAKLWKLDGTAVTTYQDHKAGVWAVDFSQDQTKVITASWDKTLKLWDINGKLLRTFKGHQDRVWEVEYGPKDRIIASGSWDRTARLWTPEGKLITILKGHKDRVWGLDFTKDGKVLATASWDKTIKLWDVEKSVAQRTPVLLATLTGHKDAVNNVDFAPGDRTIASASNDGTIILWDVSNPTQPIRKKTLRGHRDRVISIAYNHKTGEIVSTSDDKTIKIWSPQGTLISTLKGHRDRVVGLGVRRDGGMIASGGYDKTIRLWQPQNYLLQTLEGHQDGVWQVDFSADGRLIASGSRDSTIKLWTAQGKFIRTFEGHRDRIHDVAFNPQGNLLASASDDRTVKIWDISGNLVATFKGYNASVFTVVFSPDGKYLATASEDHEIKIWNLQGQLIKTFQGHQGAIIELTFSRDGRVLASASRDNTVKLWSWLEDVTQITTLRGHEDVVYSVVSSPDNQRWITSSWDGTIKIWNLSGQEIRTLQGHTSEVNQISISPNGQIIASAGADKTVRLWNQQGEKLLVLERHDAKVWSVDFSSDGKTLISAGDDRQIILWDLESISRLDYFKYACNWLKNYLKTNPNLEESDRRLCNQSVNN